MKLTPERLATFIANDHMSGLHDQRAEWITQASRRGLLTELDARGGELREAIRAQCLEDLRAGAGVYWQGSDGEGFRTAWMSETFDPTEADIWTKGATILWKGARLPLFTRSCKPLRKLLGSELRGLIVRATGSKDTRHARDPRWCALKILGWATDHPPIFVSGRQKASVREVRLRDALSTSLRPGSHTSSRVEEVLLHASGLHGAFTPITKEVFGAFVDRVMRNCESRLITSYLEDRRPRRDGQ